MPYSTSQIPCNFVERKRQMGKECLWWTEKLSPTEEYWNVTVHLIKIWRSFFFYPPNWCFTWSMTTLGQKLLRHVVRTPFDILDKAKMFCSGGILENLSFVKTVLLHSIKIQIKNMHAANYSLRPIGKWVVLIPWESYTCETGPKWNVVHDVSVIVVADRLLV